MGRYARRILEQQYMKEKNQIDDYEELLESVIRDIKHMGLQGKAKRAYVEWVSITCANTIRPICTLQRFIMKAMNK